MSKRIAGATGAAVITATVVAIVLIESGPSDTRPPASASAVGEDPPTVQTAAPIPAVMPPRSRRAGRGDEPPANEVGARGGASDEQDNAPAPRSDPPAEEKQEGEESPSGSLPPELEELRGEPARSR
jgi:hypothetical protein